MIDKANAPDNSAKLIADAAAAVFKVDAEAHENDERMHTLHKEMEGWVARAVLRYQKMVEERDAKSSVAK